MLVAILEVLGAVGLLVGLAVNPIMLISAGAQAELAPLKPGEIQRLKETFGNPNQAGQPTSQQNWTNPEWKNPEWALNPVNQSEWKNPAGQNPNWQNPEMKNPDWRNPDMKNPEWKNPQW